MKKLVKTMAFLPFFIFFSSVAAPPDLTKGESKPKTAKQDWTLGPTGLRGWIYTNKLETSEARQILITEVETASPAAAHMKKGDVILGVSGKNFSYDPRTELGKAISAAEAADGKLSLVVWRNSKVANIDLKIQALGAYSATAPFNCSKSKAIFERGCEALAKNMEAGKDKGNWISRSFNNIALLASGNEKYYPLVKAQVKEASDYILKSQGGLRAWYYGPVNIMIAEYVLATGDKSVLPQLEAITMSIVDGQSVVGSWGHKFVDENKRLSGYGMMNSPGVPLTISMVLARKAGVSNSKLDTAITKSVNLLRFYVGKGSIPYGDHHPWIQNHDDNGKNGMAAILFNLLGDKEAARYFSSMSIASYGAERETGHTGNFFNILYAMPAVALSGPNASGAWLKEFGWYYDLARKWDGTYLNQGAPDEKDRFKKWDANGVFLLAYAQPLKKTYMTGKSSGLINPISTSEAATFIEDGRGWTPRFKELAYQKYSVSKLYSGLKSWSPVVRERSAKELARRKGDDISKLREMLKSADLNTRIGACQAIGFMKGAGAPAIPELKEALNADDTWLQIKAAEALAGIGQEAMPVVPKLLHMLNSPNKPNDPRGMLQRYLCFALFNGRGGLIAKSLDGVDKQELLQAVKAGLKNEDGRARGAIKSVYNNLSLEELKPLLPAIYEAIVEPAPSGIMFANEIQDAGLQLFAKHKISQGLELTAHYVRGQKQHGSQKRIIQLLRIIESYGAHAQRVIPILEKHIHYFENEEQNFPKNLSKDKAEEVRKSIAKIKTLTKKPDLITVKIN